MDSAHEAAHRALAAIGFDAVAYVGRYPDLVVLGSEARSAADHFLQYGLHEGRDLCIVGDAASALAAAERTWPVAASMSAVRSAIIRGVADAGATDVVHRLRTIIAVHPTVAVVGDSHSWIFGGAGLLGDTLVLHRLCTGGSARGLANPSSHAGYSAYARSFLDDLSGASPDRPPVLMQFGQVDLEFVYNFHRIRTGQLAFDRGDFRAFMTETVERYTGWLHRLALDAWPRDRLFAVAALPPSLADAHLRTGYVNAHIAELHGQQNVERIADDIGRLEFPDQRVRTGLHREFNALLRNACGLVGVTVLDAFDQFLGADGVAAEPFVRSHGGTDHHLDPHAPETRAIARRLIDDVWADLAA